MKRTTKMLAGLALFAFVSGTVIGAETIFDLNFADEAAVQQASTSNNPNKPNERATGKIIKPFADNTAWCNVWTEYDVVTEDGKQFQRIDVKKIEPKDEKDKSSCGQIVAHMKSIGEKTSYKLKLKARSSTSSEIRPMIRLRPNPYTKYWGTKIDLTPEWKDYEYDVEVDPTDGNEVSFYIQFPKVGTVDIAEFKLEKK